MPHKFLVLLHDGYMKVRNKLRDFLVNHMPKLYLKLRVLKHRKKAEKQS